MLERILERLRSLLGSFPAHTQVYSAWLTLEPWTIDNGLLTPTMKLKHPAMERRFAQQIRALYAEHALPAQG